MNTRYIKCIIFVLMFVNVAAKQTVLNDHDPLSTFSAIAMPIDQITDTFTQNVFSIIDQTFGSSGMGLQPEQVNIIKNAYLYLIFLTKLEKIKTNVALKIYQSDFERFLQDNKTSMPHLPDAALINSVGWKSVVITSQDMQNSTAWQLYCKTMVTDIYVYYVMVLEVIHNVEKQTFNYIPHFETSFYDADYTDLRTLNEMSRTRLILEDHIKQKFLSQILHWSTLPGLSTVDKNKKTVTVESEVVAFRTSMFYKNIRKISTILAIPSTQDSSISNQQLLSAISLKSPVKEYVWCYYLLYEAVGQITSSIHQQNLDTVLMYGAQSKLLPNLFPYDMNDYVLLDELLSAKSKFEGTHTKSIHPSPQPYHIDQLRSPERLQQTYRDWHAQVHDDLKKINNAQVQAQMWDFLKDLGHDFTKAFDDIKSGVEAGFDAVKDLGVAVGVGIAGIGAELVGQTSWAHKEFGKEGKAFEKSVDDLNNCLDDFSSALKDGIVAPMAEVTGDLVAFIAQDQKLGQDVSEQIDKVSDVIVDGADDLTKALSDQALGAVQYVMQVSQISSELAVQIGTAAWAIFSKQGQEEFLKQGKALGEQCLVAITQAYTVVKNYTVDFVKSILKGLSVITNAITTIFIDLVREITYVFTGGIFNMLHLSSIPGLKQAVAYSKEQADNVTNTLQSHRAVMNQIIGVVGCIAADAVVDTATGGAGVAADAEMDAAIEGAAESADVAGEQVVTAAGKAAEKGVLQSLKDFGSKVAEQVSTKVQATIEQTKNFASDFAKSAANILKSNQEIADLAAKELVEKQAALTAAKTALTDLGQDATPEAKQAAQDAVDQAQSDVDDAEKADKNVQEILKESKLGKVKRLSKAAFAKLGTVLKPVGLFMNVTFNMGSMVSGYNQDEKNKLDVQTQSQTLQKLWSFNNTSQMAQATLQLAFVQEMEQKVQAQVGNQALQTTLAQNVINQQILTIRSALASYLAQIYVQYLIPNATTGLQMANIATAWNMKSPYLDLYPSQGFFSTTLGRPDFAFAQEIAQAPEVTQLATGSKGGTSKLWFNQRCTARDDFNQAKIRKKPTDPLSVQVQMQVIYTLDSALYAGLYLAGNYHDYNNSHYVQPYLNNLTIAQAQEKIQQGQFQEQDAKSSIVDLDEAHLAKMVVLYRLKKDSPLMLGVYEHEGLGWIVQEQLPAQVQLNQERVYNIQAVLNGSLLQIKLLVDNVIDPIVQKTVTVTASANQRTYGIIASGVSMQWNQIDPVQKITDMTKRAKQQVSEIEREQNNKIIMAQISDPKCAAFQLKPVSKQAILAGQYLYATTNTDIKKLIPNNGIDFVIFGNMQQGQEPILGIDPVTALKNPNPILVSVINGLMYDLQGKTIGTVSGVWDMYQKIAGPFNQKIQTFITNQQKAIASALAHVTFGSFDLDIVNSSLLASGQYVYHCAQTLRAASGDVIMDPTTQKPKMDYICCAQVENGQLTIGLPPTAMNANALYSFVTGNVYSKTAVVIKGQVVSTENITTNPYTLFASYAQQYNLVETNPVYTAINKALVWYDTTYKNSQSKSSSTASTIKISPAIVGKSSYFKNGFGVPFKASKKGYDFGAPTLNMHNIKSDFSQRQAVAAGSLGFQFPKLAKKTNT